jgi:hypothetical protein
MYSQKRNCVASPNFNIHVSVSKSVHIFSFSRKGRPILGLYKALTETCMRKLGLRPRNTLSGNISFEFSVLCLCYVVLTKAVVSKKKYGAVRDIFQYIRTIKSKKYYIVPGWGWPAAQAAPRAPAVPSSRSCCWGSSLSSSQPWPPSWVSSSASPSRAGGRFTIYS